MNGQVTQYIQERINKLMYLLHHGGSQKSKKRLGGNAGEGVEGATELGSNRPHHPQTLASVKGKPKGGDDSDDEYVITV